MSQSIIYKKIGKSNKVKLFGKRFVKKNKSKIKLEIKGKEYQLIEYFPDDTTEPLEVKIKGINKIKNTSSMFEGCNSLISLSGISKWNTAKVTNMSRIFSGCSSLTSLPVISN